MSCRSRGVVSREDHSFQTLVPRQEMTGADRSWAQQYQVDDILRYSRSSRETGIEKGEYSRVVSVNAEENKLTVLRSSGQQTTYDPRRQMGVSVYREQEKVFSAGDRIQFTAPSQDLKIANRELGTVESIAQDGTMRLKLDNERSMSFDPQRHPHLDHGYAVTSYSSQGQTADRVLINVDTELGAKDLLNNRMAYVSVSRGQWDAQIFTNDRSALANALATMFRTRAPISRSRQSLRLCRRLLIAKRHVTKSARTSVLASACNDSSKTSTTYVSVHLGKIRFS